jgi:hypothetical protein
MMMRKPTRVASSATVAKLIRNPVVRHMEHMETPSPSQRASSGKGVHVHFPVDDVHRRCRPMVSVTVPPEGAETVYEIQLGEMMEVRVMAVAGFKS